MQSFRWSSLCGPCFRGDITQQLRRISRYDRVRRHILCHDAAGADNGVLSDDDLGENRTPRTDGGAFFYEGLLDLPILFALQLAVGRSCTRVGIVDESHAMADEHIVLDNHAFTNKAMAGDFAVLSDRCVLLNFN